MRRFVLLICGIFFSVHFLFAQSYGLRFNSHEAVPEKRTSLDLSPGNTLQFSKDVRLDFDLSFVRGYEIYFGYVLRIINNRQNIDVVYDQQTAMFRIIAGQNFSGISFSLDSPHLYNNWNAVSILLKPHEKKLQVRVNNKLIGSAAFSFDGNNYKFLWGANDFSHYQTRDIPPMRIKDIKLYNGNSLKYNWSLNEVAGNTSVDEAHQQKAVIKNPAWIKPAHQEWSLINSSVIKGNAVIAFDKKSEILYISGSDSVLTYNLNKIQNPWQKIPVSKTNIMLGSQAIYDTITNKLYDVSIDKKQAISFTPGQTKWNNNFHDTILTEFWQANKFLSPIDTSIYVIGGYGQLKYKNTVQRYSIPGNTWNIVKTGGDFFSPRYLSALGMNASGDTAFIIGGYGSRTGNQMLDPGNYSDMYAFDVRSKTFKKLFNLDSPFSKFTFANSLVIDSKNQEYYGLIFPNDSFNSNLQLIKGSLKNPSVISLGSKIPYSFYDVQSFADLYYSPQAAKLIAVTLYYTKFDSPEKFTNVKIYTIDFPPGAITASPTVPAKKINYPIIILAAVFSAAILFFIIKKKKRKPLVSAMPVTEKEIINNEIPVLSTAEDFSPAMEITEFEEELTKASGIFLFGQFQVFDKEENDITELFTPLIKELFLLIVIYTFRNGRGITSDELNEILWSGKSVKDAKNNRSVNMTKLKNIVEKIGDCALVKKSNFWQFQINDNSVCVDYEKFIALIKDKNEIDKNYIKQILKIAGKGSFLFQTEYNWLDDVKAEISNSIIDVNLHYLNHAKDICDDPEFVIDIANCIFYFDRLNEDALEYKCKTLIHLKRHALANKTYTKFLKDYKDMYGEEFEKSFHQVLKNDSESHSFSSNA